MIVLPIFWDQHDNAQRVDEAGYGVRLPTYTFDDDQLVDALSRVLSDPPLRAACEAAGRRLRDSPGTTVAATLIEQLASSGEPVIGPA
jgi:UDP:flavonoid glycosyltransferase YjiC (YdhE family)